MNSTATEDQPVLTTTSGRLTVGRRFEFTNMGAQMNLQQFFSTAEARNMQKPRIRTLPFWQETIHIGEGAKFVSRCLLGTRIRV